MHFFRGIFSAASVLLILSPHQISSQVIDYDQSDYDGGLGENFDVSVKASCVGGAMKIRVDTKLPFEGIIHGPNRTEAGCSVLGRGARKTFLSIDLTKPPGSPGSCGVKYNKRTEERRVAIAVRAHPTIELLDDKVYVVSCGPAGYQNSRNEISVVQMKVTLPSAEGGRKIDTVLEGKRYKLAVDILEHDKDFDFLIRRCFAFDETDTSLQLIDDRGCKDDRLISDFSYQREAGTAQATIYSMFRLPHSNRTYFQCDVVICRGKCPEPQCTGELPSLEKQGELQSLDDRNKGAEDPFDGVEDDSITTSTSVFVAQPGSAESAAAVYCNISTLGPGDADWLVWLAIAFGILFGIMLLINIFLCSAMTCSCTKSEIIEKEPSIYDDYSIYESQYGYAKEKAYGSESDFGSDYAIGHTNVAPGDFHHDEVDADGYQPKNNYQQSTLSRSRH